MIREKLEDHIDNMIVKTSATGYHMADLTITFYQLMKYDMRLHPKKCDFGVQVRKFLGFILTQRGIDQYGQVQDNFGDAKPSYRRRSTTVDQAINNID